MIAYMKVKNDLRVFRTECLQRIILDFGIVYFFNDFTKFMQLFTL